MGWFVCLFVLITGTYNSPVLKVMVVQSNTGLTVVCLKSYILQNI